MRSGFFNSEIIGYDAENMPVFDRAEEASFFAKYFSQFISNGVFPNPSTNMQVLAGGNRQIEVGIGTCYINGYMGWVEPAEIFEIEESDTQARIDRVVARLDFTTKDIQIKIKKGTPLGNPVAPELQRNYDIYELGLADIRVNANAIEITQENITDLRLNTELCGVVANQLQHVDTTTLFNQYLNWLNRVTGEAETNLSNMETEFEQSFNNWFQTVQNVLDGNIAGNLLNLINAKADVSIQGTLVLLTENWIFNETTQKYEYTVEDSNITEDCIVTGYTNLDNGAKIPSRIITNTYNGGFKAITAELPEEDILLDILIQHTKAGFKQKQTYILETKEYNENDKFFLQEENGVLKTITNLTKNENDTEKIIIKEKEI